MAQEIRCFLYNHEDLNFISITRMKTSEDGGGYRLTPTVFGRQAQVGSQALCLASLHKLPNFNLRETSVQKMR